MKTQLHHVYEHEQARAHKLWLTQPMGGGRVRELTWSQGMREARCMAAHLRSLELPAGSKIAILAKNNAWWLLADLAVWMAGHVTVPIYPTLAPSSIAQILDHSEARLIFIGKLDGFAAMEPGIPSSLPRIALPLAPPMEAPTWERLIAATEPIRDNPVRKPDEIATIIYTSGSTGAPKGAMHSFATMCAAKVFIEEARMTPEDRLISYLPLAHVAERAVLETTNFLVGYRVFFADTIDSFVEDVRRAQPTIFGAVPRIWQKLQSGVHAQMPPAKLSRLLSIPLVSTLVRRKVLAGLGLSNVRWACTGSAPTPPLVYQWYAQLGLELLDVYGMTENFAVSHIARAGRVRAGYVGAPQTGVTQQISDDGEILVKSPGTMLGYYKDEALTDNAIDSQGFLHTGDRGEVDAQGRLRITGRTKELFKTSKGKYVAPVPIEDALLTSESIEQVCVLGANLPQPLAVIVLSEVLRQKPLTSEQRSALDAELSQHMSDVNRSLDHHEHLSKLVVAIDEWTIDNGLLTPTLKIKRPTIESRYAARIEDWSRRSDVVIWGA